MALTREFKETVVARIKRDRKSARALYAEALSALNSASVSLGSSLMISVALMVGKLNHRIWWPMRREGYIR